MQRMPLVFAGIFVSASIVACAPDRTNESASETLSLGATNGKKHYFGFGIAGQGDPTMMHNEVKYDVKHTHDVFSTGAGGTYDATTYIDRNFSGSDVRQEMSNLRSKMGKDDMYVQYSSGHGYQQGLGIGVKYSEFVDHALSMPAKEVVIFMMACYSGGMVDQFNSRRSEWSQWEAQGRTLFVMSSSSVAQTSSTGPSSDGKAGSAYGHALWKSLSGDADGFVDGVKDGFISLSEIAAYATAKTQSIGKHKPQVTGVYNPLLIMNRVPSGEYLAGLTGGTDGMSESEIRSLVSETDERLMLANETLQAAQ